MSDPKSQLERILDAIHEAGESPDVQSIKGIQKQVSDLYSLIENYPEKQICFRAGQRLTEALKFKTGKKRKALLNQAKDKLSELR